MDVLHLDPQHFEPHSSSSTQKSKAPKSKASLSFQTLVANAIILRNHGEIEEARVLCRQALNQDPGNPLALKVLADMITPSAENLSERLRLAEVRALRDSSAEASFRWAALLIEAGDLAKAKDLLLRAALKDTEDSELQCDIHRELGNLFLKEGDLDSAEESFFRAVAIHPDSEVLQVNLGSLAIQKQDWGSARDRFMGTVQSHPSNAKAWIGLAMVHRQLGELEIARGNLDRALDLDPASRLAVHLKAAWCLEVEDYTPAIESLQEFLSHVHFDREMSLALIHLLCEKQDWAGAMLEIERSLAWDPMQEDLLTIEQEIRGELGE